ncbi:139_t:CDS:10 [Entrophospora sp. SA101]|nr:139_t:CDS:10 [Entrophospora sp. SA101]
MSTKLNKLSNEKSPYLLQHATNPVDWYPWGKEAFKTAKEENKLIFLSVGYSTCQEVQPDVDRMYMTYVQALTGHGGWPMSVFLTPELYPIFGGTYWPAQDQPGFPSILKRISALWKQKPDDLRKAGEETIQQLQNLSKSEGGELSKELNVKIANKLYQKYLNLFDESQGGFDDEPKFPTPVNLNFLLRYYYYQMSELDRSYENYPTISINEIKRIGNSLGIDFKDLHNEAEYVNRFKSTVENRKNNAQKALEMVKFTLKEWAIFYGFYGWLSYDFILRLLDKTPLTVEIKITLTISSLFSFDEENDEVSVEEGRIGGFIEGGESGREGA